MKDDIRDRMVELLPRLRRFAYVLTADLDKADDLVQETCVRALSSADQWQPGTRLDSWMYRIAQNLWVDRVRSNKVRGHQVDIDAVIDLAGSDGRRVTESRLTLNEVAGHIANLSPDQQLLITMVCIDRLSYKEAAEALELPIGTVMSRLARARQSLSAQMQGEATTDAPKSKEVRHERNLR